MSVNGPFKPGFANGNPVSIAIRYRPHAADCLPMLVTFAPDPGGPGFGNRKEKALHKAEPERFFYVPRGIKIHQSTSTVSDSYYSGSIPSSSRTTTIISLTNHTRAVMSSRLVR
jgi:hypothetical protein